MTDSYMPPGATDIPGNSKWDTICEEVIKKGMECPECENRMEYKDVRDMFACAICYVVVTLEDAAAQEIEKREARHE